MNADLIPFKKFLSELRLHFAFGDDLGLKGNQSGDSSCASHKTTSNKSQLIDLSLIHLNVYAQLDGATFQDSQIFYYHPVKEEPTESYRKQRNVRPFIKVSEAELEHETWIPRLDKSHKEIWHLPVAGAIACKLAHIQLSELFLKPEHSLEEVALDGSGDLVRRLASPVTIKASQLLVETSAIKLVSTLLTQTAIKAFKEHQQQTAKAKDFQAWLESILKSRRAITDPFLPVYLAWAMTNKRFPQLNELKSVFHDLFKNTSGTSVSIGLGDDPEDIRFSNKFELFKANERVAKVYMKNFVNHCFRRNLQTSPK